jgi:hypothetical protein
MPCSSNDSKCGETGKLRGTSILLPPPELWSTIGTAVKQRGRGHNGVGFLAQTSLGRCCTGYGKVTSGTDVVPYGLVSIY